MVPGPAHPGPELLYLCPILRMKLTAEAAAQRALAGRSQGRTDSPLCVLCGLGASDPLGRVEPAFRLSRIFIVIGPGVATISGMGIRTFLALPLDQDVVGRLLEAQRSLDSVGAEVRWVEPANLHLTVKFLGDVRDEGLPEVCAIAIEAARQVESFDLHVAGLTSAPPMGQVRMVWAKIHERTGRLQMLYEMLEDAFASLDYKRENRLFHPHMTLGRVKSGKNVKQLRAAVEGFADTEFGIQAAEELIVFSSELTSEGPIYSPLTRARLGG